MTDGHDSHYAKPAAQNPVKVAVTGAGGLIGRALVPALARDARVSEVVAIDVRPLEARPDGRIRILRRDVSDPGLDTDLEGVDALVHLAFRELDIHRVGNANLGDARSTFAAAVAAGVGTIVHASSGVVYGSAAGNPVPLREDHPLRPGTFAYPRTKVAIESLLDDLEIAHPDVRVVRLRPTTVLAPGAPLLLADRAYVSLSDFNPPTQFTWVDDVVAAFVAALHVRDARGAFNVAAPGTVRASEIARIVGVRSLRLPYRSRRAAASAMVKLRVPGALHPGFVDIHRYPIVVSSTRAQETLGWRAEHDTGATLERFRATLR